MEKMNDKLHILLMIEDNPQYAGAMREMLAAVWSDEVELEWADQLSTGLEKLVTEDVDVILLDLVLPDSQGFETFAAVHARAPDVPIIVMSGLGDEALAVRTVRAGAQDYLVKEKMDGNLLVRAIRYAIERKRAEKALLEQTQALSERVKELNCLYGISGLVEKPGISLKEILQGTVDLIPAAWQYPEITAARIVLEDREFRTENFGATLVVQHHPSWKQTSDIVVLGERAGAVEVCYLEARPANGGPFLKEERNLINAIAERLGKITERKRAEEALRQRNRALALLNRAGQALNATLDLDQVLTTMLEEVCHLLDVVASSVWLIEPPPLGKAEGGLICQRATGPQSEIVRGWRLAPGEGIAGWVARTGESLIVPDAQADERHFRDVDQQTGLPLRSILSVPLQVREKTIAVLQVVDTESNRFNATDLELLELLAASAATATENAQLHEQAQQEIIEREQAQDALRALSLRYKAILAAVPDIIVEVDSAKVYTWANQAGFEFFGDDLLGQEAAFYFEGEQDTYDVVQPLFAGSENIVYVESWQRRQDGEKRLLAWWWRVLKDADGHVTGALSTARDITEQKQVQDEIREVYEGLEQRVADRTRELAALYDVTAVASESLDLNTTLERSLERVLAAMRSKAGDIYLLDEADETLYLATHQGVPPEIVAQVNILPLSENMNLESLVIERGEPLIVPDLTADPQALYAIRALYSYSYVGVPLRAGGRVLGVLNVAGDLGRLFSQEEVALLASIADHVGVAVEGARLRHHVRQTAVLEERERLARELHDSVTQLLYSLTLLAEGGRRLVMSGEMDDVGDYLADLGEISRQALMEMRLLVYQLRPLALERDGIVGALQQRLDAIERRSGVQVHLFAERSMQLPTLVEQELYYISQEALNNALKHADARSITVRLDTRDGQVTLQVEDDGVGFDPDVASGAGGLGLSNMRERARRLGGTLTLVSSPGEGTMVEIVIMIPDSPPRTKT
ncbi:MAG: GAF domain-containing protein [Anaerolineae bacterium]